MRRILMIFCLSGLIITAMFSLVEPYAIAGSDTSYATGIVFHDLNGNRKKDAGEKGLANIRVSNGREIIKTDPAGRYRLPVTEDTILFVIKPRGWRSPLSDENLPQFYYIHKPKGSPQLKYPGVSPTGSLPESVDFPLYPQKEPDRFRVLLFGDTQPRNQQEIDYIAHDVVEGLIGFDAAFGVTLGDIVFDGLEIFESLNKTIARIGVPWHNVLGNHDMNYDLPDDELSDETFERIYGPSFYSFDYGPVHFIALNDVMSSGGGKYRGGLGPRQMEFLRNDLALLLKSQLVALMMHIPLPEIEEKKELFQLLEAHPNILSLAAHYHTQAHLFLTDKDGWKGANPHHHLIHATVCGSWWSGAPDEMGIPHTTMADGAPNGYSIVTFDKTGYSIEFRAARRPAGHQMSIFAPEEVKAEEAAGAEVLVNVFAGSERSKVEMRLGEEGPWTPMAKVVRKDPYFLALKEAEASPTPPPGRRLPNAADVNHMWRATLPPNAPRGTYLIHILTTDMFGHTYTDQRVIRVR